MKKLLCRLFHKKYLVYSEENKHWMSSLWSCTRCGYTHDIYWL